MNILDALLVLKEQALTDNVYHTNAGICYNLNEIVGGDSSVYNFVADNSEDWEHYSGVYGYPVKLPNDCNYWRGEQLQLRLSLIDHLITKSKNSYSNSNMVLGVIVVVLFLYCCAMLL